MTFHRQKPAEALQGRGSRYKDGGLRVVGPDESRPIPPAPATTQPQARRAWRSFWRSRMASAVELASDGAALYRWLHCLSERERLQDKADKVPLVKGSTGQLALNPLFAAIAMYSKEIARYEDHFGMTALSRWRLGITAVEHETAVADLRERREAADPPRVVNLDDLA